MSSFPTADYILKQQTVYINKQKKEAETKDKRDWYKIPKDCRDRLLKEIRAAMHNITKSSTPSQMINFQFLLTDLSYNSSNKLIKISEDIIHYFIRSFNSRMFLKDKNNKNVLHHWHITLNTSAFKEFSDHPTTKPLQLLLSIKPYKDKELSK